MIESERGRVRVRDKGRVRTRVRERDGDMESGRERWSDTVASHGIFWRPWGAVVFCGVLWCSAVVVVVCIVRSIRRSAVTSTAMSIVISIVGANVIHSEP